MHTIPQSANSSGANGYNISFSLTDAADVFLRLARQDRRHRGRPDAVSLEKGENSLPVYSNNIPEGEYEVDIVVDNKAVAGVKELFRNEIESSGVAVDCNPASPFFGNAYFTIKAGERGGDAVRPHVHSRHRSSLTRAEDGPCIGGSLLPCQHIGRRHYAGIRLRRPRGGI